MRADYLTIHTSTDAEAAAKMCSCPAGTHTHSSGNPAGTPLQERPAETQQERSGRNATEVLCRNAAAGHPKNAPAGTPLQEHLKIAPVGTPLQEHSKMPLQERPCKSAPPGTRTHS